MTGAPMGAVARIFEAVENNLRIIWALMMRELSTRYGRNDLGFLWVIVEPLVFAGAVSVLWSIIKPPYEHGIKVVAFVVTGYLPLILIRQTVSFGTNAARVNQSLLYHRQITPLHLFVGRFGMEFLGISLAFFCIVMLLNFAGIMSPPANLLYIYGGWFLLAWITFGFALILAALTDMFEFVDKFVQVTTYILIPLSGAFFMAAWLPPSYRHMVLILPFIHCFEMIRRGFFGEFATHPYFDVPYALVWGCGFNLLGLLLVQFVRGRMEVE